MKNISFSFILVVLLCISSFFAFSQVSTRVSGDQIILEFDLTRYDCGSSEITAYVSLDAGKAWEKMCCAKGNIGMSVSDGLGKKITWNVMEYTNGKPFAESNVKFWIHQKTCYSSYSDYSSSSTDDIYSTVKSFDIKKINVDNDAKIKVAVMPVFDKYNKVESAHKLLIRTYINSALIKTDKFTGLDFGSIDAIIDVIAFEEKGFVSETQRNELGKMHGAKYLLKIEVDEDSKGYIIITASIIEISTGKMIPDKTHVEISVEDALSIQNACKKIAEIMFN